MSTKMDSKPTDKLNKAKNVDPLANTSIKPTGSSNYTTPTTSKDELTNQANCSSVFAHDQLNLGQFNEQNNPNMQSTETRQINLQTVQSTSPLTPNNDGDSSLPNEPFLPSPFLQNPINQLDSLLLSSEKERPKRVTINVGGVRHEGTYSMSTTHISLIYYRT